MSDDFGSIEIKIDMSMHDGQTEPTSADKRIEWAYLDTAYKLIRIAAVRVIFEDTREQLVEAGLPPRTDEELLQGAADEDQEKAEYLDLAADEDVACAMLAMAYSHISSATADMARKGLEMAQVEARELPSFVENLLRDLGLNGE